jgi:transposase InsO family protein
VPRSSFYRDIAPLPSGPDPDTELLAKIEPIALEWPRYGYRRITAELAHRGCKASHRRVLRLMRRANLLVRRRKRFVATTNSDHGRPVYANLVPSIALVRVNQLWVADITYIAMAQGFVYLAVILDAYSRKAVGWALSARIDTNLTLEALHMALRSRGAPLYHHSDRGVQYASAEYVKTLSAQRVQMSMSRKGNPYDNANMESFMKTLKVEEVYTTQYNTEEQARHDIDHFIGCVYNDKRLHSALGYLSPTNFESGQ